MAWNKGRVLAPPAVSEALVARCRSGHTLEQDALESCGRPVPARRAPARATRGRLVRVAGVKNIEL